MLSRSSVGLALVVVLAGFALAQAKPDFSGTWEFDKEKSEPAATGAGGPGGRGMVAPLPDGPVVIRQTAVDLVIERQGVDKPQTLTYKLDGGETTNVGMRGSPATSHTRWEGSGLVIETTQKLSTSRGDTMLQTTEVRTLDETGQIMTVVTTAKTPRGETKRTTVFRKAKGRPGIRDQGSGFARDSGGDRAR